MGATPSRAAQAGLDDRVPCQAYAVTRGDGGGHRPYPRVPPPGARAFRPERIAHGAPDRRALH